MKDETVKIIIAEVSMAALAFVALVVGNDLVLGTAVGSLATFLTRDRLSNK